MKAIPAISTRRPTFSHRTRILYAPSWISEVMWKAGLNTYTEMLSYYLAPVSKEVATIQQKNASIILGLYALADIGIHEKGWTKEDTLSFFSQYGIGDEKSISEIYQLILGDPGNYAKYYFGYLEFLELKKAAIAKWGEDFS